MKPIYRFRDPNDAAAAQHASDSTGTINDEPSMTEQHHAESADLNVLMSRFGVNDGAILPQHHDPAAFGDFTDAVDFSEAMMRLHQATTSFNALPADLRNRFHNDPGELFAFVHDPANHEEAVRIGLLHRTVIETPPKPPEGGEQTPKA